MNDADEILVLSEAIRGPELGRLVEAGFGDMVKYVVDVERHVIAIGGELHADSEQRLLDQGSRAEDLWGANYYPGRGSDGCIEYTSLINIRPARGNPGMEIADPQIRDQVRSITFDLVGKGGALP
jgi:hypothetical protein